MFHRKQKESRPYRSIDFHLVNKAYRDYQSQANQLFPTLMLSQVKFQGIHHQMPIDVLVMAMESHYMDSVGTVHNQQLVRIQLQLVQLHDFLEFDLWRIRMEPLHLYILL